MVDKKDKDEAINTYNESGEKIPPGMLSSPHIAYCVEQYKIITEYDDQCLGSATYHMRIGGKVVTWEKGEKIEFTLGEKENKNENIRSSIDLRPNSFTFITTIESFNLPKDIIARFNLKSKWVHRGLLLGTGPIVDPEFQARLLIPLHNFSSHNITLKYNDKIISVEFTKTSNPDVQLESSGPGLYCNYKKNKSRSFNINEYLERIGGSVESSVSSKFDDFEVTLKKSKNVLKKNSKEFQSKIKAFEALTKKFNFIGMATVVGTFIGLIVLVITTWMLVSSAFDQQKDAINVVKQYKDQNVDFRAFTLKTNHDDLQKKFLELKKYSERLNIESYLKSEKREGELQKISDTFEERFKAMASRIEELEKNGAKK